MATGIIVAGVVAGPGTVSCIQRGDFGQCMSETFLGSEPVVAEAGQEPASEGQAVALSEGPADEEEAVPAGDAQSAEEVAEAVMPSFSVVRVEPDGSAVIAGTATPSGEVQIYAGEDVIGTETAEASGDWAHVTERPLDTGGLELRAYDVESEQFSESSVVVVVQDDRQGEPLVVATAPGEASEILQGIERTSDVAQAAQASTPQTEEPAPAAEPAEAVEQAEPSTTAPEVEVAQAPETQALEIQVPETQVPDRAEVTTEEPAAEEQDAVTGTQTADVPAPVTEGPDSDAPTAAAVVADMSGDEAEAAEETPPSIPAATETVQATEAEDAADSAPAQPEETETRAVAPTAAPQPAAAQEDAREASQDPAATRDMDEGSANVAPDQPEAPVEPEAEPQQPDTDEPAVTAALEPEAPAAEPEAAIMPPSIDAVEIDGDRNFFAGAGTDGYMVRLYVDNQPVGTTEVSDGRWLVEATNVLDEPSQRVRVDMLAEDGSVVGRAEVEFVIDLPVEPTQPALDQERVVVAQGEDDAADQAAAPQEPDAAGAVETPAPSAAVADTAAQPDAPESQPVAEDLAAPQPEPAPEPASAPEPAPVASNEESPVQAPAQQDADVPTMVGVTEGDRVVSGRAIIRRGDNLWTIARRVYGEGIRYMQIYEANNEQIRDPDLIYPGQVFDLPNTDMVIGEQTDAD